MPNPRAGRVLIDDWIDYYNNDRYQWGLEKLSPNEYWQYICSGIHPLDTLPP
jgi:transposase InsO family protein